MSSLIDKAFDLANKGHEGQFRKDGITPYIEHPKGVVSLLRSWGIKKDQTIIVAYLHDLLEDTNISKNEILNLFGDSVLKDVEDLTLKFDKNISPDKKIKLKQKKLDNLALSTNVYVRLIKIADRIYNVWDFVNDDKIKHAEKYFYKAENLFKEVKKDRKTLGNKVYKNVTSAIKKLKDFFDMNNDLLKVANNVYKKELNLISIEKISKKIISSWKNMGRADGDKIKWHNSVTNETRIQISKPGEQNKSIQHDKKQTPTNKKQTPTNKNKSVNLFSKEEINSLPEDATNKNVHNKEEFYKQAKEAQNQMLTWLDRGEGVDKTIGAKHYDITSLESFNKAIDELDEPGPVLLTAPIKGEKRALEKVEHDYKGDWSHLTDGVRATIAVDNLSHLQTVVDVLHKSGMKIAKKPKDRFSKPTTVGYRDVLLNVEYPNGHVGELQLHVKPMLKAKERKGHQLYEKARSIEVKLDTKDKKMMPKQERIQYEQLEDQMTTLYSNAWRDAIVNG